MDIRFANLPDGYALTVALGSGQECVCRISPPTGRITFVDILPDVFALADAFLRQAVRRSADDGQPVTCSKGCAIYPCRPLLCRQYLATSPPVHCRGSFKADHLVRKLPLACDLASAAASFDGLSAQVSRPVPLPALLLLNGLLQRQTRPQATATAMLTAFWRHAADNFSC